jgi:hypothetical protein
MRVAVENRIKILGNIMEHVVNGLNLVDTQPLGESAVREIDRPVTCERRLLPGVEFLFTGQAAFHKLEQFVAELAKTTDDLLDVVVVLLPLNIAIREIRYTEANTIFLCDADAANKFRAISIRNGHPFNAALDIVPKRSQNRQVTGFTDQTELAG